MASESLVNSMMRAARLDATFYEEVEQDASRNTQALTVVIIAAVAAFFGNLGSGLISRAGFGAAIGSAVFGLVMAIAGYYIWSYVSYLVGTRLFGGTAEPGELLRTIGFAYAPQVLAIFNVIPCVGGLIAFVGAIWALVAGVFAVRQALNFDTGKAVLTVIVGWLIIIVITAIISAVLGVGAFGLSALTGGLQQ